MENQQVRGDEHRVTTVEQLRAMFGEPHPITPKKVFDALHPTMIDFIGRSPFLVLGTADEARNVDASPKGDGPGFVAVQDPHTILIPERKGNKLMYGLQNILTTGQVGILFMIPGTDETLRVNGVAELSCDPVLLNLLVARGAPALLAIRVTIAECFFHCAKAFIRSQLWAPETWMEPQEISFGKLMAAKVGASDEVALQFDKAVADDYKNNL
jgi:PPOX class probable FMN-dependent enzyme